MPATFSNKHNLSNVYHSKFKVMKNWKSAFLPLNKWAIFGKTYFQFLILFTVNGTIVYETGPIW